MTATGTEFVTLNQLKLFGDNVSSNSLYEYPYDFSVSNYISQVVVNTSTGTSVHVPGVGGSSSALDKIIKVIDETSIAVGACVLKGSNKNPYGEVVVVNDSGVSKTIECINSSWKFSGVDFECELDFLDDGSMRLLMFIAATSKTNSFNGTSVNKPNVYFKGAIISKESVVTQRSGSFTSFGSFGSYTTPPSCANVSSNNEGGLFVGTHRTSTGSLSYNVCKVSNEGVASYSQTEGHPYGSYYASLCKYPFDDSKFILFGVSENSGRHDAETYTIDFSSLSASEIPNSSSENSQGYYPQFLEGVEAGKASTIQGKMFIPRDNNLTKTSCPIYIVDGEFDANSIPDVKYLDQKKTHLGAASESSGFAKIVGDLKDASVYTSNSTIFEFERRVSIEYSPNFGCSFLSPGRVYYAACVGNSLLLVSYNMGVIVHIFKKGDL